MKNINFKIHNNVHNPLWDQVENIDLTSNYFLSSKVRNALYQNTTVILEELVDVRIIGPVKHRLIKK